MSNILITGANGGFGKLSVHSLIESGHNVIGTMRDINGRNKAAADEMKAAGAQVLEMDVTNDESVNSAVDAAINHFGKLDVVINNAGVGVHGMQEHFTVDDFQRLFDINVFGVQRVNRAALPHMRKNQDGLIIYVSSLLGRMTLPFYGPYNASKWALEAIAENYRTELSGFGVQSAIVEPGGYPTTFMTSLMTPSDQSRDAEYGDFMNAPKAASEGFAQALEANPAQNPQKVADAIVNVVNTPKADRAFRTVVDEMGMGDPIKGYNDNLHQLTQGIYTAFGMDAMLNVK